MFSLARKTERLNGPIFELELGLRTAAGQLLHDPEQLKTMLAEAGFHNIQYAHLPSAPYYLGLMLADTILTSTMHLLDQ